MRGNAAILILFSGYHVRKAVFTFNNLERQGKRSMRYLLKLVPVKLDIGSDICKKPAANNLTPVILLDLWPSSRTARNQTSPLVKHG